MEVMAAVIVMVVVAGGGGGGHEYGWGWRTFFHFARFDIGQNGSDERTRGKRTYPERVQHETSVQ
jgi:hypothetical protein